MPHDAVEFIVAVSSGKLGVAAEATNREERKRGDLLSETITTGLARRMMVAQ